MDLADRRGGTSADRPILNFRSSFIRAPFNSASAVDVVVSVTGVFHGGLPRPICVASKAKPPAIIGVRHYKQPQSRFCQTRLTTTGPNRKPTSVRSRRVVRDLFGQE